ncbi:hypothetical protein OPAG_08108 [Rhodococcus opacus PD630]|uniref:SCO6880 family protein n=1 Tax=Rhodococcus opacus TaxID=37919 RepID=UPI00029CB192|nr:SCO6880 family protein [Rhodococcus opacus]EHI41288.1 hypothetical protein OPAG_08108 [Rhodococcus opacus PD630]
MALTFGRLRQARGRSPINGWTGTQVVIVGVVVMLGMLTAQIWLVGGLVFAAIALPTLLVCVIPLGAAKRTLGGRFLWWLRGWRAHATEADQYAAGPLTTAPRGEDLPGVAAPLMPLDVEDGRGGRQLLMWNRATGIVSARLRVAPVGLALADESDGTTWVNSFSSFEADLGYKPFIEWVSYDIESSPTGGVNQREYTLERIAPDAPEVCKQILTELVPRNGASTADVSTSVTLHFNPAKFSPAPKDLSEVATEVVRWLPGIESALASSGAAVLGRATTPWAIRRTRAQYDPGMRGEMLAHQYDADTAEEISWRDAGPIRTGGTEHVYRTDSGYHISWVLEAPPRGTFTAAVLLPLLAPGRYYRRVSMHYQPYPAGETAELLEHEVTGGQLRQWWAKATKRDETQRERDDRSKAQADTRDESFGAGVGRWTAYITTSVVDPNLLDAAAADVEDRVAAAKMRFRRATGSQGAIFAVSQGWGIDPTQALTRSTDRWDS